MEPVIELAGLAKCYPIYARPLDRLKEMLVRGRRRYHQEFWALDDVSVTIGRGETVGVIGANGSGKSTLLQLVAGVLAPTRGTVTVNGRVAALLELGAGFDPEFSGRDNVYMGGAIMGISRHEMDARFDAIVAFAELGEFIDQPVKTYSSGMYVRLAFALAINVDPEVLLVDEALSVGDAVFQHRCMHKIRELQARGVTILFVSHDTGTVKSICTRAVWLEGGRLVEVGTPEAVVNHYHASVSRRIAGAGYDDGLAAANERRDAASEAEPPHATTAGGAARPDTSQAAEGQRATRVAFHENPRFGDATGFFRHGTGAARFCDVELVAGTHATTAVDTGTRVSVRAHLRFDEAMTDVVAGFYVKDRLGVELVGSNTAEEGQALATVAAGDRLVLDFAFDARFRPGHYSLTVAAAYNRRDPVYLDWVDNALVFEVLPAASGRTVHGLVDLPVEVAVQVAQEPAWT